MKVSDNQNKNYWIYFSALISLAIFIRYSLNLNMSYLWFDEAGQFFISLGLNHDSPPQAQVGGIYDVILNNRFYNLDPGGFSLILHYWAGISQSHVWLRTLPFLFFLLALGFYFYLVHKNTQNLLYSMLALFFPILSSTASQMSVELRAYSMEMLSTVFCLFVIQKIDEGQLKFTTAFCFSIVLSLLMTARYASIVVTSVCLLFVLFLLFTNPKFEKSKFKFGLLFITPFLITVCLIYFQSLYYQNKSVKPLFYLDYLNKHPEILLSFKSMVVLSFIVFEIIFLKYCVNNLKFRQLRLILLFSISINVIFILLSFLGVYPWAPFSNRLISAHIVLLTSFAILLGLLFNFFSSRLPLLITNVTVIVGLSLVLGSDRLILKEHIGAQTIGEFQSEKVRLGSKFYVDRWESPFIRYLFEFSDRSLAKKYAYPDNFYFEKAMPHSEQLHDNFSRIDVFKGKTMDMITGYDYLVAPELYTYTPHLHWTPLEEGSVIYIKSNS